MNKTAKKTSPEKTRTNKQKILNQPKWEHVHWYPWFTQLHKVCSGWQISFSLTNLTAKLYMHDEDRAKCLTIHNLYQPFSIFNSFSGVLQIKLSKNVIVKGSIYFGCFNHPSYRHRLTQPSRNYLKTIYYNLYEIMDRIFCPLHVHGELLLVITI